MTLLQALAMHLPDIMTVVKSKNMDFEVGRQFRWYNGHIQTRISKDKTWHRIINFRTWWLEGIDVVFEIKAKQKD